MTSNRFDFSKLQTQSDFCRLSDRETCDVLFKARKDSIFDNRLLGEVFDLTQDWNIERKMGGGKSGAFVFIVSPNVAKWGRKTERFVLKLYMDAFVDVNEETQVRNERPFREMYTQCVMTGEKGFNCLELMGIANWPESWIGRPNPAYPLETPIDDRLVAKRSDFVVFMVTSLSTGTQLMDLPLEELSASEIMGGILELSAVWQNIRKKIGSDTFTHWDFHPENIFLDYDEDRRRRNPLPFAIRPGKSVMLEFPTVTLIDFDLVSSPVFDDYLPEHRAKQKNMIGLTERAIQWTIRHLGYPSAILWFGFLAILRRIPYSRMQEDRYHLMTYQFCFFCYYVMKTEFDTVVGIEEVVVAVMNLLLRARLAHFVSGPFGAFYTFLIHQVAGKVAPAVVRITRPLQATVTRAVTMGARRLGVAGLKLVGNEEAIISLLGTLRQMVASSFAEGLLSTVDFIGGRGLLIGLSGEKATDQALLVRQRYGYTATLITGMAKGIELVIRTIGDLANIQVSELPPVESMLPSRIVSGEEGLVNMEGEQFINLVQSFRQQDEIAIDRSSTVRNLSTTWQRAEQQFYLEKRFHPMIDDHKLILRRAYHPDFTGRYSAGVSLTIKGERYEDIPVGIDLSGFEIIIQTDQMVPKITITNLADVYIDFAVARDIVQTQMVPSLVRSAYQGAKRWVSTPWVDEPVETAFESMGTALQTQRERETRRPGEPITLWGDRETATRGTLQQWEGDFPLEYPVRIRIDKVEITMSPNIGLDFELSVSRDLDSVLEDAENRGGLFEFFLGLPTIASAVGYFFLNQPRSALSDKLTYSYGAGKAYLSYRFQGPPHPCQVMAETLTSARIYLPALLDCATTIYPYLSGESNEEASALASLAPPVNLSLQLGDMEEIELMTMIPTRSETLGCIYKLENRPLSDREIADRELCGSFEDILSRKRARRTVASARAIDETLRRNQRDATIRRYTGQDIAQQALERAMQPAEIASASLTSQDAEAMDISAPAPAVGTPGTPQTAETVETVETLGTQESLQMPPEAQSPPRSMRKSPAAIGNDLFKVPLPVRRRATQSFAELPPIADLPPRTRRPKRERSEGIAIGQPPAPKRRGKFELGDSSRADRQSSFEFSGLPTQALPMERSLSDIRSFSLEGNPFNEQ